MASVSTTGTFLEVGSGGARMPVRPWWKPWGRRAGPTHTGLENPWASADPNPAIGSYGVPAGQAHRPVEELPANPVDLEQAQFLARLRQAGL